MKKVLRLDRRIASGCLITINVLFNVSRYQHRRHEMISRIILGLCISLSVQAAQFPPLEDLMSQEEMEETGLDKLDEVEREAFRRWLEVFVEHDADFVQRRYREQLREERAQSKEKGAADRDDERSEADDEAAIVSNIDGEFSGWDGRPRFELANGQVWEHRRKHTIFSHRPIDNPKVIIKKNFLGFFVMEIPQANVTLPVRRVK